MVVIEKTTGSICMEIFVSIYSVLFFNVSPVCISFEKLGEVGAQEVVQVSH